MLRITERKLGLLILFCLIALLPVSAQQLELTNAIPATPAELPTAMPEIAKQLIAKYKEEDRQKYLDNLFRLQILADDYSAAIATIKQLRDILKAKDPVFADVTDLQYEIFSKAKLSQSASNVPFNDAFQQSFREIFQKLSNKNAYIASSSLILI